MFRRFAPAELQTLVTDFAQDGVAIFKDVLEPAALASTLAHVATAPFEPYVYPYAEGTPVDDAWRALDRGLLMPGMTYRFFRTTDHPAPPDQPRLCDCGTCSFRRAFEHDTRFLDTVSLVTGQPAASLYAFFSRYTEGCYLSTHSDKGNGTLAFVLNLTEEPWQAIWGGCLHLLAPDWRTVKRLVMPQLNELIVFDVTGEGRPHFVSPIAAGVPHVRHAYSGWFRP